MPDSSPSNPDAIREQLELFRVLYPVFKDEVFRRRGHMIGLSAFHSAWLVLLVVLMLVICPGQTPPLTMSWLAMSGIAIFSGLVAFLILQHADRHHMAKQQLIELETRMGLFKKDGHDPGVATYPENWQTDWLTDRSVILYLTVLTALTVLVLCVMLVQF